MIPAVTLLPAGSLGMLSALMATAALMTASSSHWAQNVVEPLKSATLLSSAWATPQAVPLTDTSKTGLPATQIKTSAMLEHVRLGTVSA